MANTHIFNNIAGNYDTDERKEIALHTAHTIKELIKQLDIKGRTLLDYGCGTGLVGLKLLDLFDETIFVDASEKMVEAVWEKINSDKIQGVTAICSNAAKKHDPLLKGDVLIMTQVLLHEPDVRGLLSRLYEAVNPGGTIIIVDFERNDKVESDRVHSGFELMQLQADLLYAGFEPIHSHLFLHAEKFFMGEDASLFVLVGKK